MCHYIGSNRFIYLAKILPMRDDNGKKEKKV